MTTSLLLMIVAGVCALVAIFVFVAALTTKNTTDGQRTLMRVTREAARSGNECSTPFWWASRRSVGN